MKIGISPLESVLLFLSLSNVCWSFVVPNHAVTKVHPSKIHPIHQLQVVDANVVGEARVAFLLWFFGGSGGCGIAVSAFPRMFNDYQLVRSLATVGPTLGGDTVGISPLCGYPTDVAVSDIEQIANAKLSVDEIVSKYPIEGNFLSEKGYLTFSAFQQANSNANPLALRVIFDSFNAGSDVSVPDEAQQVLDELRRDPGAIVPKVLSSKLKGYSAIAFLVFLLALAVYQSIFVYFRQGWFPEWPGLDNLPASLFDGEAGLTAIPNYWLGDV